jgi:hypothetical protein
MSWLETAAGRWRLRQWLGDKLIDIAPDCQHNAATIRTVPTGIGNGALLKTICFCEKTGSYRVRGRPPVL